MWIQFVAWSKFKIDETIEQEQDILEKFEKRFGKTLPLDRINLLFVLALEKEKPVGDEAEATEEKKAEE